MTCSPTEMQFDGSKPGQWHHQHAKHGHHDPHGNIWYIGRIDLSGFELVVAVVSGQHTSQPHKHLAQWGMHIEVKRPFDVVRAELAKMGLRNGDMRIRDHELLEIAPAHTSSQTTVFDFPIL